jgi:hypothetical protein
MHHPGDSSKRHQVSVRAQVEVSVRAQVEVSVRAQGVIAGNRP